MISLNNMKYMAICAFFVVALGVAGQVLAQDEELPQPGLMPAQTAFSMDAQFSSTEETHPPLRLTPDRSEIIELDEDVDRVIIGADAHMTIFMDTPRRMIVVPRMPGATHFTLLGDGGKVVMRRYAIVANPKEKYIRIRETCRGSIDGCMPIRMYYCPGMCHEIAIEGEDGMAYSASVTPNDDQPTTSTPAPSAQQGDEPSDDEEQE